jgi:hypothetical protein
MKRAGKRLKGRQIPFAAETGQARETARKNSSSSFEEYDEEPEVNIASV